MAEQLGLDQRGRQRGQVQRMKGTVEIAGERLALRIERHVPRQPDGARHQLLARAGQSHHERGDVTHVPVERPPVAAHVVGEY